MLSSFILTVLVGLTVSTIFQLASGKLKSSRDVAIWSFYAGILAGLAVIAGVAASWLTPNHHLIGASAFYGLLLLIVGVFVHRTNP